MLTRGIIQKIDYNTNLCTVRLPLFETANTQQEITSTSTIAIPPGVFNGYKPGDVVVVGFNSGEIGDPVIIGKLYVGSQKEAGCVGGAINCQELAVTNRATLPATTMLSYDKDSTIIKNAEITGATYNSINDIISGLLALRQTVINNQTKSTTNNFTKNENVIGNWLDNKQLYQQTIYYTKGQTKISLSNIDFDTIWIDLGQSFYIDNINGSKIVSNPLLTSVDLTEKIITVPEIKSDSGYGYITIKYTKK